MPKEQINYPSAIPVNADSPDSPLMQPPGPEFSIHWSPGPNGYVQLGVEFDVKLMRDYLAQLAKDSPMDGRSYLYSEPLDRAAMQRLVKHGRRARDAVHGADE